MIIVESLKVSKSILIKSREKYINNVNIPLQTHYSEEVIKLPSDASFTVVSRMYVLMRLCEAFEKVILKNIEDVYSYVFMWARGTKGSKRWQHFQGLYGEEDLDKPLLWCELGYLWYYVLDNKFPLEIKDLKPEIKVCVLRETDPGFESKFNYKLKDYKSGISMTNYLMDIKYGLRYMPISLFHAFKCLVADGIAEDDQYMKEVSLSDLDKFLGVKGLK